MADKELAEVGALEEEEEEERYGVAQAPRLAYPLFPLAFFLLPLNNKDARGKG